jgi:hypothetical protein
MSKTIFALLTPGKAAMYDYAGAGVRATMAIDGYSLEVDEFAFPDLA